MVTRVCRFYLLFQRKRQLVLLLAALLKYGNSGPCWSVRSSVVLPITVTRRLRPCHGMRSLCLHQTVITDIRTYDHAACDVTFKVYLVDHVICQEDSQSHYFILFILMFIAIFYFFHRIIWPSGLIQYGSACPCTRFWQHLAPLLLNADVLTNIRWRKCVAVGNIL